MNKRNYKGERHGYWEYTGNQGIYGIKNLTYKNKFG
jgi:hypothetical protein